MGLTVVGVGPGDPELMTLKAVRALEAAEVVAYPTTSQGSLAARIAAEYIADTRTLPFHVPMSGDGAVEAAYDEAAARIAVPLQAGRSVALLCEGDPMLYGSAVSLLERLGAHREVRVIPAVTGFSAAAALTATSLGRGEDTVTIVPATAGRAVLRQTLARPGSVVIYKVGRHFDEARAAVVGAGRTEAASLVIRASWPDGTAMKLAAAPPGIKPYFSTILVPETPRPTPSEGEDIAIVVLGRSALSLAHRARAALAAPDRFVAVHGLATRLDDGEVDTIYADAMAHVSDLFARGVAVVGICAAAILIRAVAPLLSHKAAEPPLIALAEDGSCVVPLLGGHRGGNALAARLADALGVAPSITTRSEVALGLALDDPPAGFVVADPAPFKPLATQLAQGGGVTPHPSLEFLDGLPQGSQPIRATIHAEAASKTIPTYVARRLALGMGAERGADPGAAVEAAARMLGELGLDGRAVALVASLDKKADEPAIQAVADALHVPLRVFEAARLAAEEARLVNPSEVVRAAVGVPGVAEAAALAAAGETATLLREKTVDGRATFAIALAERPIAPTVGRARGKLAVVGIGPGAPSWRTAEAVAALARADAFVGYSLYLDLVEDVRTHQSRHDFALGEERERVRFALEHAGEGNNVALISSGDAGIYAMASLAAELLHEAAELSDAARRAALQIVPGVSAGQAAAARAGAPLGHDFAFVSLSDLMTPWPQIETRLEALARADFVVALYNPRSSKRTEQLGRALSIMRSHRPPETPVIVASHLGRRGEAVRHTRLEGLDPASVHMLTTLIVGASTTRTFVRGDGLPITYTPRGYRG